MASPKRFTQIEILDESTTFTLREVCERGGTYAEFVLEMVAHGIIEPVEQDPSGHWRFDATALTRLRQARRLQRDLDLNLPGLAVTLDLLEDVHSLRQEVDNLQRRLRNFEEGSN